MQYHKIAVWVLVALGVSGIMISPALANKASIQIEAPGDVVKGTTITITLNVSHKGNNWFHYTNWVRVAVNGSEVKRWEYTRGNRPESENFGLTFTYTVVEPVEIVAEANCNLHGSVGPATLKINLR